MAIIVDIQGFKVPDNQFVLKELGIIRLIREPYGFSMGSLIFQPPCTWGSLPKKYRLMNQWCINNLHGIPWEAGTFDYTELHDAVNFIFRKGDYVLVKGAEKKLWLEELLQFRIPVIDLGHLGCPPLPKLSLFLYAKIIIKI